MDNKPKILLCWGYHRKGWLHAFNALSDDFDFYYLFHLTKPAKEVNHARTDNILYWTDFHSSQQIISTIKPVKIVFMGIDSPNTIALNTVAKSKNIETLIVQHGMFHKYSDYLRLAQEEMLERKKRSMFNRSEEHVDRFFLLKFFLRSVVMIAPLLLFYLAKLKLLKRKHLEIEALKMARSRYRQPDKYIVFTKYNASIYNERDGINEDMMIEMGNPELDAYCSHVRKTDDNESYYLLIDQPWAEVKEYASPGYGITQGQTNNFYQKLADFADKQSAKLKIKLHPYSYNSTFLIRHSNIEYLKDADMVPLIMNSEGVFGFNSTLTLPAIYYNRCCLFKIWDESNYQNEIEKLKLAQVLDYHSFTEESINFDLIKPNQQAIEQFVKMYFYKVDGKAIVRLRDILHS